MSTSRAWAAAFVHEGEPWTAREETRGVQKAKVIALYDRRGSSRGYLAGKSADLERVKGYAEDGGDVASAIPQMASRGMSYVPPRPSVRERLKRRIRRKAGQ